MLVAVLSTALQVLVRTIISFVWRKSWLRPIIHPFPLMKEENLPNKSLTMKEFMWKMPIKSSLKTLKKKAGLYFLKPRNTTILSAGEATLPWFIKPLLPGSLELLNWRRIYWKIIWRLLGSQESSKRKDSLIGSKTLKIGASREADIGEIPFHCGFLKMDNKLSVLVQWKSLKS